MNIINAIKIGNIINLSINGILEKKICATSEEAKSIFEMVLKTKADPTDLNIKNLFLFLNNKVREVIIAGFECDLVDGNIYLQGFNTPVPDAILDVVKDYNENNFPYETIINFWKLLMINPDEIVRKSLFDFISKFNLVLSNYGYFLAYKAVKLYVDPKSSTPVAAPVKKKAKKGKETTVKPASKSGLTVDEQFIAAEYNKVKNTWKCAPKNYTVYVTNADGKPHATETKTFAKWNLAEKNVTELGCLKDMFELAPYTSNATITVAEQEVEVVKQADEIQVDNVPVYTDKHTGKMRIILGKPVQMERKDCNGDPKQDCSYGLHVGSTKYVESFASSDDTILLCLVNPAHVVAVPNSDTSKMRVSEYFPISIVSRTDSKINAIQQSYFESDYIAYEQGELNKMADKIRANQYPIAVAKTTKAEDRPLADLLKIIESRLIDLK